MAWSHVCLGCEAIAQEQDNLPDHAKGVKTYLVTAEAGARMAADEFSPKGGDTT